MKNKRGLFRTVILTLFCVAFCIGLTIPISSVARGFIRANQELVDTPPEVPRGVQNVEASGSVPLVTATRPQGVPFVNPQPRTNPFAKANSFPQPRRIGFAGSDPMLSFIKKIQDAENEDDKQDAIEQARAALEKHYDRYIEGYQKQVDEMEERMQKLRDQLDKRKDAKDRLVDLKLEMLISQADGLGWPEASRRFSSTAPAATFWRTDPTVATSGFTTVRPTLATAPNHPLTVSSPPTHSSTPPRVDMRGVPANVRRPDTIGVPPVSSGTIRKSFKKYFEEGTSLLEKGKYGHFLDQYLEPQKFRKALKSKTLDQVAKQFEKDNADKLLILFEVAAKSPMRQYSPGTRQMTWKLETDDEVQELHLIWDESSDRWYLRLPNSNEK